MKNQKNYCLRLLTLAVCVLFSGLIFAQIDRSVQPKPGPSPKITLEKPQTFELKNGITVLVVENHKLPRLSISMRIDNGPIYEGDKSGVSSLLSAMLGNGTTSISKDDFNDEIDFLGASLGFGAQSGFASSLSKYQNRIIELMADAAINPLLTLDEFEKEKERALEGLKGDENSVDAAASRVGSALSYGKDSAYGEFVSEESLKNINLEDVIDFYNSYFKPNNAYIVIVGDVNYKSIKKLIKKKFGNWEASKTLEKTTPTAKANVPKTEINFIDMPNAVQSNISLTSNVKLSMSDDDYHAVLIANKILGGGFNSYLNMNLREENGYTYGARSGIGASRYKVSRFTASTAVRNMVTDSAVVETIKEINKIRDTFVDEEKLKNAKAKYVGDFVLALERPSTVAGYALDVIYNNLPDTFYENYLEKINAVSIEDVKRVANTYFNVDNARIIIVGKGSDIVTNLEKTGIPIKYFDKYANPTEKPEFSKPIPEGINATSIMVSYIEAIGGKDAVDGVKTLLFSAEMTIEGAPFKPTAIRKSMAPNKSSTEIIVPGMGTMMKEKFDGESGYSEQGGMKNPMSKEDIDDKSSEKVLFPELHYTLDDIELISLSDIDGKEVYKIKVNGSEESFRYYEANSGLLVRVEESQEAQGQSMTSITVHSDYREVNGILIPFSQKVTVGPQILLFDAKEVLINSGVTDEDFK
ncbi:MAG: peptidase M16 [Formosa sp.]|nr:peptidase M16 [Formosa sp.]|tara:strand:- start:1497 stop:3590 length:2094 start_codon:yes stop_codon:yes gene_type:complete